MAQAAQANDATMVCPQCGATNKSGANFCIKCGAQLQQSNSELSINDRVKHLKDLVDEMVSNLKSYSFQELETVMLTNLNRDKVYPSVQDLRAMAESKSGEGMTQSQRQELADKQRDFIQYLDSFDQSKLAATLADYEAQKIAKVGQVNWLELKNQYDDLCGQLKSMNKFQETNDTIDFDQLFEEPVAVICQDAKAAGQRIIKRVGVTMSMVNNNSIRQIKFLMQVQERLNAIAHRVA